jgi:hypothetical protein
MAARFERIALTQFLVIVCGAGIWRLRLDRTYASTAGVCASISSAATACLQSIQPLYSASTELHTTSTLNTKHDTFHTKHHSKR